MAMASLRDYFITCAKYNTFANDQIITLVEKLSDQLYYKSLLRSSRSIHEILNHVLAVDLAWIGEMKGQSSDITSRLDTVCVTRADLFAKRRHTDIQMAFLIDELAEEDLSAMIEYRNSDVGQLRWPFMLEVAHVFRHGSHHRGQISILLEAAGVEAKIDELFVPTDVIFEVKES
jgi:uncharacterized damage-inducible protein DinB